MTANQPDLYHVAIHEAGHAVATLAFGHNLLLASFIPGKLIRTY